jgi:starvation-inducible DNA-binding protein
MSKKTDVVKALSIALADTYVLYLKTQNYHWNVTGPRFQDLHTMFEGQYTELAEAVDDIAERIRALDAPAPGSFDEFTALTTLSGKPVSGDANKMLADLAAMNEGVTQSFRQVAEAAQQASDVASEDFAIGRISNHEKVVWMLKATTS